MRILVVEDDKSLARVLTLKLEKEGFEVSHAENGEFGLEKVLNDKFDLVLLDLVMPKMNGFEFLEKMAAEKNKTSVIVLSNLGQEEDREKTSVYENVVNYIIKSNISLDDVIGKINKELNE